MTKEKYMALADLQTVWANKIKPWISSQLSSCLKEISQTQFDNIFKE